MSGMYYYPLGREFLSLNGGVVSGDTFFLGGLSGYSFSANTFYSAGTPLEQIIKSLASTSTTTSDYYLPLTGGTGGPYNFTGDTTISQDLTPIQDNVSNLGTQVRRFRNLNTVNGVSVFFTASTKISTNEILLGDTSVTENNIILTGQCVNGGSW